MKDDTSVLLEFLQISLTSADEVFAKFMELPGAVMRGSGLERFLFRQGTREDRVLLVAHADTCWDEHYGEGDRTPKIIVQDSGIIKNQNGGLGADDRAGCAMAWLLKDMGHSVLITNGQEHGLKGSNWLMNENRDIAEEINKSHQFALQLDRRNGTDYKCYTVGTDAFRKYIEHVTGYSEPDRRYDNDIVILCRDICGVNLSVGYHREHTNQEYLVLDEWQRSLDLCRGWLSRFELPRFCLHDHG